MDSTTSSSNNKRKRQEAELEEELHHCARDGDFDRVRELVEIDRVSIDCTSGFGQTPLIRSALHGNIRVVRYLIGKGANIHAKDRFGDTALRFAVYHGHVEVAQLLLENDANVEARCARGGYSPLGLAISKCTVDMVSLLLRFGANTEETLCRDETNTAVYFACRSANAEVVQLLLTHNDGVDINTITPKSGGSPAMTPLCQASKRSKLDIAQLLIQYGARVVYNGVYPNSPSPLKHAVEHGSLELVRFLLDNSRFSVSANENPHPLPEMIGDVHPLSPPLEAALQKNKLEVAQLLVGRGANVNDRPFLWQCAKNDWSLDVVRFLLRFGANVNLVDSDSGETPLWAATKNGNAVLVKEFIKARADVNIRDNGGETPLEVARRLGHKRVVYLLLRTSPHVWPRLANVL